MENGRKDSILNESTMSLLMMAVSSGVLAFMTLFTKNVSSEGIIRTGASLFIVCGAFLSIKYLFGRGYMRLNDYSFSTGILLVILGICGLLSAPRLVYLQDTVFSLLTLVAGVYFLQCMIQFIRLNAGAWILEMIAAMLAIASSLIGLLNGRAVLNRINGFVPWALLISSGFAVISVLLSAMLVHAYRRRMEQAEKEAIQRMKEEEEKARQRTEAAMNQNAQEQTEQG